MAEPQRRIDRRELLRAEWVVMVGEALVAAGSVVVVIGLVKAFRLMLKDSEND